MSPTPLHNRSTFWYIVVSIFVGLAVLFIDRYLSSLSLEPKARVSQEPKPQVLEERKAQAAEQPARSASDVDAQSRDEVWRAAQTWKSSIQSGDVEQFRERYADRLARFYNHADVPIADVVQMMLGEVQKYPIREFTLSDPSFQLVGRGGVQLDYDKEYRFSGPGVRLNQGKVKATLRFADTETGTWKITAEFDREICWSTLMRDPFMQSPPGTYP